MNAGFGRYAWFASVTRQEAEQRLGEQFEGTILLRPSSATNGIAVTVKLADGFLRHSLIERTSTGFTVEGTHGSIFEVIDYLEERCGVLAHGFSPRQNAPGGNMFQIDWPALKPFTGWYASETAQIIMHNRQLTGVSIDLADNLRQLARIDLSSNLLPVIPDAIFQITTLTHLLLSENKIARIPAAIQKLTSLTVLALINNPLVFIDPAIGNLSNLETLSLGFGLLSAVPSSIGRLASLLFLRVYDNRLVSLPNEICDLTRLVELEVGSNLLTSLPDQIGRCRSLKVLYAHNNKLVSVPASVANCHNLAQLHLQRNQIRSLPAEIGQLTRLRSLSLDRNDLSAVPPCIGNLISLKTLALSNNPKLGFAIAEGENCVFRLAQLLPQKPALKYTQLPPEQTTKPSSSASSSSAATAAAATAAASSSTVAAASTSNVAAAGASSSSGMTRQIDFSELDFGSSANPTLLGKGATARVLAATFGGIDVAVKLLHCEESEGDRAMEAMMAELSIASLFSHPHIVQVLACAVAPPNFAIVMERMQSSLYYDLHVQKRTFSARERLHVARGVAAALAFVHAQQAMHRDIKSANVLLGDGGGVKVTDFGTARLMTTLSASNLTANVGTAQWTAPEVLTGGAYDTCADVYSFGILLWELYAQQVPYAALSLPPIQLGMQVAMKQLRPTMPVPNAPSEMMELAQRCWATDPATRPAMAQVVQRLRAALELAKQREQDDNVVSDDNEDDEDKLCVVCMATKRDAAMQCGHVALCVACGTQLDKCPLCNAPKQALIKLYGI